jgi:hypothetical protein
MLANIGMVLVAQALAPTILIPERCVTIAVRLILHDSLNESNGDLGHRLL